jgi:cytoskeletal protein RodZ
VSEIDGAGAVEADDAERPSVAGFGRWLRLERELRQLSRDDVVRATRLTASVIDGLESGERERMPPSGYVYGYLRTYAGALGLDADDVVLRWQEVEGAEEPPEPPRRALPVRAIAIGAAGVAVAALAFAWILH